MNIHKSNPVEEMLKQQSVLILDGALATELETYGCDLDDPLWSAKVLLEQPEAIVNVHKEYFQAGADCVITASYQATVDGFAERGLTEAQSLKLIKNTVELAQQARGEYLKERSPSLKKSKPLIAASVGPYGAYLADGSEYVGHYDVTDAQLRGFHRPRMKALIEAGADIIALETIPSFREAKVLASLMLEFPDAFAWLSFTLKNENEISDGTPLRVCGEEFDAYEQVAAIGVNCAPIDTAAAAVGVLNKNTDKPVLIYPNSGETYNAGTNTWHGENHINDFDVQSEEWRKQGASIIGGCCRTTPSHIRALSERWS
ncbi:homocysteine S-methyltransferase [Halobacillus litoralis]|uniref:S-methylmethionine:homocysteine methyltransferase n=1 Tax=Halobacillus litoralis TaxID=45668 RepID=A0A410MBF8_9BACI|nr:homocysteine S-methyltransferase [Halobacillus litoralis]QAS52102.1 homocysteine S-methyltransferase [Halobacillus litoralis]